MHTIVYNDNNYATYLGADPADPMGEWRRKANKEVLTGGRVKKEKKRNMTNLCQPLLRWYQPNV